MSECLLKRRDNLALQVVFGLLLSGHMTQDFSLVSEVFLTHILEHVVAVVDVETILNHSNAAHDPIPAANNHAREFCQRRRRSLLKMEEIQSL